MIKNVLLILYILWDTSVQNKGVINAIPEQWDSATLEGATGACANLNNRRRRISAWFRERSFTREETLVPRTLRRYN